MTQGLVSQLRELYASPARNHEVWLKDAADEIDRLQAHVNRRRDTLSWDLEFALRDWKDAGAPTERVVHAIQAMVQGGIDFVIAEFGDEEKT